MSENLKHIADSTHVVGMLGSVLLVLPSSGPPISGVPETPKLALVKMTDTLWSRFSKLANLRPQVKNSHTLRSCYPNHVIKNVKVRYGTIKVALSPIAQNN